MFCLWFFGELGRLHCNIQYGASSARVLDATTRQSTKLAYVVVESCASAESPAYNLELRKLCNSGDGDVSCLQQESLQGVWLYIPGQRRMGSWMALLLVVAVESYTSVGAPADVFKNMCGLSISITSPKWITVGIHPLLDSFLLWWYLAPLLQC